MIFVAGNERNITQHTTNIANAYTRYETSDVDLTTIARLVSVSYAALEYEHQYFHHCYEQQFCCRTIWIYLFYFFFFFVLDTLVVVSAGPVSGACLTSFPSTMMNVGADFGIRDLVFLLLVDVVV